MGDLFQCFWHGPLTAYERLCITSFVGHGHAVELYAFDTPDRLPAGCAWRDAAEIYPRSALFGYRSGFGAGSVAAFANLFRYRLLSTRGGWWIDADMLCLSPRWPEDERQAGLEEDALVNVAVLRAPAGDPLIGQALAHAERLGRDVAWGDAGPRLFTRLIAETPGHGYTIHPRHTFYSLGYRSPAAFLAPGGATLDALTRRGAVGVHLWNAMLLKLGLDKHVAPPAGSLLHEAFAKAGLLHEFEREYGFDAATNSLTTPRLR